MKNNTLKNTSYTKARKTAIIQDNFSHKKHKKQKRAATTHTKFDFKYAYGGGGAGGGCLTAGISVERSEVNELA